MALSAGDRPPYRNSEAETEFLARRSTGGEAALWISAAVLVVGAVVGGLAVAQSPGVSTVLLAALSLLALLVAGALFIWGIAYRGLVYELAEEGLTVFWLGRATVIPYAAIDGVFPGQKLVGASTPRVPTWPGIFVGPGRMRGIGRLHFFSTSRDPATLTLIATGPSGVVVSAREPLAFRSALVERVREHEKDPPPSARLLSAAPNGVPWTALHDRWSLVALGLGCLLWLATLSVVALAFAGLPERVPVRFDASGVPNDVGARGDLFRLPGLGLAGLILDWLLGVWLHAREPVMARLLWICGALLQVFVLVAVVRLVQ